MPRYFGHDAYESHFGDPNDVSTQGGLRKDKKGNWIRPQQEEYRGKGIGIDKSYVHADSYEDKKRRDEGEAAAVAVKSKASSRTELLRGALPQQTQLDALGWDPQFDSRQAIFAQMAYGPVLTGGNESVRVGLMMSGLAGTGWRVDTTFTNDMMVTFHNEATGEINIAFRGSTFGNAAKDPVQTALQDWVVQNGQTFVAGRDIATIFNDAYGLNARTSQFRTIEGAIRGIRGTYGDASIRSMTGHSRGGMEAAWWSRRFDLPNCNVDAFNAPTDTKDHDTYANVPIMHWNSSDDLVHGLLNDFTVNDRSVNTNVGASAIDMVHPLYLHSVASITGLFWDPNTGLFTRYKSPSTGEGVQGLVLDNAAQIANAIIAAKAGSVAGGRGASAAAVYSLEEDASGTTEDGGSQALTNLVESVQHFTSIAIQETPIYKGILALREWCEMWIEIPTEATALLVRVVNTAGAEHGTGIKNPSDTHARGISEGFLHQSPLQREKAIQQAEDHYRSAWENRWGELQRITEDLGIRIPNFLEGAAAILGVPRRYIEQFNKVKDQAGEAERFLFKMGMGSVKQGVMEAVDPDFDRHDLRTQDRIYDLFDGMSIEEMTAWSGTVIDEDVTEEEEVPETRGANADKVIHGHDRTVRNIDEKDHTPHGGGTGPKANVPSEEEAVCRFTASP